MNLAMQKCGSGYTLYINNFFFGRLITTVSGFLVLVAFSLPLTLEDPQLVWQHPYAVSVLITGLIWTATGILCVPRRREAPSSTFFFRGSDDLDTFG